MGAPEKGAQMSPGKVWQVEEAQEEIPSLRGILAGLREKLAQAGEIAGELKRLADFWGSEFLAQDHADAARRTRLMAEEERLLGEVKAEIVSLASRGIEVKDLESGLVDFYSVRDGELVYLCWHSGEDRIVAWHTLQGGYRGRRPLTSGEGERRAGSSKRARKGPSPPSSTNPGG